MQDFPFLNAGFPFLHAGFPFLNAGFPFLHAGFPFLHAGFPFLNAGFPFLNAGFPFLKTGVPFARTGFAPQIFLDFGRYPQKWFLAITCTIWLRLEFRDRGSAWFFSAHLLFFHAQGRIFEPGIGFGIQGPDVGPREQNSKRCAPKNHAEPRLQNSKRSHMVQVMTNNISCYASN